MAKNFPRLTLKQGIGRRVERGHLWVFSNEVESLEEGAGDEVSVFSAKGRFLGNALLSPSSLIRARIYSRNAESCNEEFITRRLKEARQYRRRIGWDRHSYRLCNGEGDMLPGLVIDVFGEITVVQITTKAMDERRDMIVEAIKEIISPLCIYERSDGQHREYENLPSRSGLMAGQLLNSVACEGGLDFPFNMAGGQKTGYYLDMAQNRDRMCSYSKGKLVLDLFCYIGGWSLRCLQAGAESAVGIDSSGPALELAREAAEMNRLADKCLFIKKNAAEYLKEARDAGERFGFIVVDPPPLARRKKDVIAALKAYRDVNFRALRVLEQGGIFCTASCSYHVSRSDFLKTLRLAAKDARCDLRLLYEGGQPPDHPVLLSVPETAYLKFFAFVKIP